MVTSVWHEILNEICYMQPNILMALTQMNEESSILLCCLRFRLNGHWRSFLTIFCKCPSFLNFNLHATSLTPYINAIIIPINHVCVSNWSLRVGNRTDNAFRRPSHKKRTVEVARSISHAWPVSTSCVVLVILVAAANENGITEFKTLLCKRVLIGLLADM